MLINNDKKISRPTPSIRISFTALCMNGSVYLRIVLSGASVFLSSARNIYYSL